MRIMTRLAAAALLTVGAFGCAKNYTDVSFKGIRRHPAPELSRLAMTPEDQQRSFAIMADQNLRMVWDDWDRVWYLDHPSRLTPYPTVYTSGQPR